MKIIAAAVMVLALAASGDAMHVDLGRYFASANDEAASRASVQRDASAFVDSATPKTARAMLAWLERYGALLVRLQRHDEYVYLKAEENQDDVADGRADDALGATIDRVDDRVVRAAQQLGHERIGRLAATAALAPYRYLLERALGQAAHRLTGGRADAVDLAVTPVLDAATSSYKALRSTSGSVESHQDAYAALLIAIVAAHTGIARLRGFGSAPEAAYFDRLLATGSVDRTLAAVRASSAYVHYLRVAALAPSPAFTPAPIAVPEAIRLTLEADHPLGAHISQAFAGLLDPQNRRLEICNDTACDETGFSLGFSGIDSVVYFGKYDGSVNRARALAHEAAHAVHRQLMSRGQSVAAYNSGPSFMFESFAIFNELLFLDHLTTKAATGRERAYYANLFLKDATFQVFGSAGETELEASIYRGVTAGSIKDAGGLNDLTASVFARYDPDSAKDAQTRLYWARNRLYFTDPLYDVNYLYAGLLALQYCRRFEADPQAFSGRYTALLANGFNDSPAALERRFLGIDLSNERALVADASALIDARTDALQRLYASAN